MSKSIYGSAVCGGVGLTERVTSVAISQTFLDCPASVMPFASSLRLQAALDRQEGGVLRLSAAHPAARYNPKPVISDLP